MLVSGLKGCNRLVSLGVDEPVEDSLASGSVRSSAGESLDTVAVGAVLLTTAGELAKMDSEDENGRSPGMGNPAEDGAAGKKLREKFIPR